MKTPIERLQYRIFEYRASQPGKFTVRGLGILTKKQAQEHCSDIETSSKTCTKPHLRAKTKLIGDWFHGYDFVQNSPSKLY